MSSTPGASQIARDVKLKFTKAGPESEGTGLVRIFLWAPARPWAVQPSWLGRPVLFVSWRECGGYARGMLSFIAKAAFGGLTIALVATIAKRFPGWGGLLTALPLTSILALTLLWIDTREAEPVAALSTSILWFVIPSLPLFVALPVMLRQGIGYWPAMAACVICTLALYALTFWALPRFGVKL
jgi:hypothetical protein